MSLLHLLEPEETIGSLWHGLVGTGSSIPHYPQARRDLRGGHRTLAHFLSRPRRRRGHRAEVRPFRRSRITA